MNNHDIYAWPELYELAFNYRDIENECAFLLKAFERANGRSATSVVELASGPASHARSLAKLGLRSTAVDISPEMIEFARQRAAEDGVRLEVLCADMKAFAVRERSDLAICMLDTIGYLKTNEELYAHFRCVADALNPMGIYVLEMEHPKHVLRLEPKYPEWTVKSDDGSLTVKWGLESDVFDPVTQCSQVTARFSFDSKSGTKQAIENVCDMRVVTATEFAALVDGSGVFSIAARVGDFRFDCGLSDKKAWRMICVLQKR